MSIRSALPNVERTLNLKEYKNEAFVFLSTYSISSNASPPILKIQKNTASFE